MTVDALAFHRMITACGETRELAAENPVQRDLSGEHEAAVAWPLGTAAYNGIEQALKMLLQASAVPTPTVDVLREQYGHDLERLYAALDPSDQDHIELHFGEHWSLYEYELLNLGFGTAREFIGQLPGHPAGPDEMHLIVRARQRDRDLVWDRLVARFRWARCSLPNWRR